MKELKTWMETNMLYTRERNHTFVYGWQGEGAPWLG